MSETVVATLFGQNVTDIPRDLFIPPDALTVILQHFEGPLDLLLYLIRKQNLDILDIPMTQITAQYLAYIEQMERGQMDLAAEYLLMASVLIEIKSRLLLPRMPDSEDEEQDPRAELARRLLEYEKMKYAAMKLDAMPQAGRDFLWVQLPQARVTLTQPPAVSITDLQQAWLHILHRARNFQQHTVQQEALSVRAQMSEILRHLQSHGSTRFERLFTPQHGAALAVVTFIAVLELMKEGLAQVMQEAAFAPIYVMLPQQAETVAKASNVDAVQRDSTAENADIA
ncbi:MAG: ScpA family protein [Neisseria sp.]|nr:ScpA family protein [Neisseria sp.]